MNPPRVSEELELIELQLLLEGAYRRYGFDFRDYALSTLRRRVWNRVWAEEVKSISGLLERVLHDEAAMERLLIELSVHVTAMYRDPQFYRKFREKVVPKLRTHPFIRIWHAGCSTGEEVYSMAILLHEEGLLDRARIYATDMNEMVLRQAREGSYPLALMQEYTANYQRAGGHAAFSSYYTASYDRAVFRPALRRNVLFSQHNLVTDGSFNEFHVILCRNVLIYFNPPLQERVHDLLTSSLGRFGYLALGNSEELRCTHRSRFEVVDTEDKIFRRIG